MSDTRKYEIVIIGGSAAGFSTAHTLLKRTIPTVLKHTPGVTYRVTIISTSPDYYWNIASPRSIVNDTLIPDSKMFANISESFAQYPAEQFRFVHGKATALDTTGKTIAIDEYADVANTVKGSVTLTYDSLIIASGSSSNTALWRVGEGSKQQQLDALSQFRQEVPHYKSILIGGGGPVGVETAGELGYEFKNAEITLVTPSAIVLPGLRQDVGKFAEKLLGELNVKIIHGVKVATTEATGTQTTVTLSDGKTIVVDKYLDATGLHPNNSFIPKTLLDDQGFLIVDSSMHVTSDSNVYGVGDIVANGKRTTLEVGRMIPVLVSNILFDLTAGKAGKKTAYSPSTSPIMIVPIGRKKGAGILMWFNLWSWFVHMAKGKTYLIEMFEKQKTGAAF